MNSETEQIFLVNCYQNQSSNSVQRLNQFPGTSQVNLENVEDFSNVCRTCATVTEFVVPIFEGEGLQNNLADKIQKHLPIRVMQQDTLPRVVCVQCASTLLAWHELVLCCVQADEALNTWLAQKQNKEQEQKPNVQCEASDNVKTEKDKSRTLLNFETTLKTVLSAHFPNIDTNTGDNMDAEFVCQCCTVKCTMRCPVTLASHLMQRHALAIKQNGLEAFITNNITQEEVLVLEDSDRNLDSDTEDVQKGSKKELKTFLCPFCESIFTSTTRLICHLNQHVKLSIDDGVMCCDVIYKDKKTFAQHLQEEHVSRVVTEPHVCRTCGAVADNAQALQTHVINTHPAKQRTKPKNEPKPTNQKFIPAVCPDCNKTFSNKYNMLVHMRSHSGNTSSYFCDLCDKCYSSRGSLLHHKKLVHEGVLGFVCGVCGEGFGSRTAREVHSRLHSGAKPYSCDYCGNSYRAKNTLDRHIEMHLDIRKYRCCVCEKRFRKRTHLNYHLTTHEVK